MGLSQEAWFDGKDGKGNTVTVPTITAAMGQREQVKGKTSQIRGVQRPSCRKTDMRTNRSLAVDKMSASQVEGHIEDLRPERASRLGLPGEMGERVGMKGGEAASRKAL